MTSRLNAAGIGRQHFNVIGRLRFFVESGGPTKGEVAVTVHPDDIEEARKAFNPGRLETALSTTGSALMVTSVFTSSFRGICLAGLLGVKGFDSTKSDLINRVFPITADRLLFLANLVHDKTVANKIGRRSTKDAKAAGGSQKDDEDCGGGGPGIAPGGSDTGSDGGVGLDSSLVDLSDLFLG